MVVIGSFCVTGEDKDADMDSPPSVQSPITVVAISGFTSRYSSRAEARSCSVLPAAGKATRASFLLLASCCLSPEFEGDFLENFEGNFVWSVHCLSVLWLTERLVRCLVKIPLSNAEFGSDCCQ